VFTASVEAEALLHVIGEMVLRPLPQRVVLKNAPKINDYGWGNEEA
jgi:hypothetical protein